jgi:hypothetical protein
MTLVEFLTPLRDGTRQDRILATLYFKERNEDQRGLTVDQIRQALLSARVKGARTLNVADVLNKAAQWVDTIGVDGKKRLWGLTDSGRTHVRELLGLPSSDVEVEHDVAKLASLVGKLHDAEIRDYLDEALKCLRVGALRACVVFAWTAGIRVLQASVLSTGTTAATAAIQKHDPKARNVNRVDDFAYVKDSTTLLAARELGVIDKNQRDTLEEALNLRNRCGHPTKYKPGEKKVSSFIEDIVSIIFS